MLYFVPFCHIRQGWNKGDLMGYNPPNPVITCYRLGRFLTLVRVGGLGMLQSIIDIPREHTCSQINKNKLFSLVLSWFDLAVTLRWPYHDIGVAPLWNPTPTHFSKCILAIGWNITSLCYLVHFCHIRHEWHEGDFTGSKKPFNPYVIPVTSWGVLAYVRV